ncbi:hypothetical protein [Methylobacterium indicum]|uniref:hypothetical protein n=1 Tax=Methylobacterium indicum TaxID=1775910 RepID=UPI00073463E2|nr:hypothetical protein [Methylobacterium indicum]
MTGNPVDPSAARDPGQLAYETHWAGFTLGTGGVAPLWADLPPAARAGWVTAETMIRAAPPAGGALDPVVEAVRADLLRRSQAGIEKYGTMLTRTDIDLQGWVRHALEEVLDLANYLKRIEMELEGRSR